MLLKERVMVGMSGGIDSSFAAYLLKKEGYEVVGASFLLAPSMGEEDAYRARDVAESLGIEHHIIDLREEFREEVINRFVKEYQEGRTPNPCIVCNKFIKFGSFFREAKKLEADIIATGHYASIEKLDGRFVLKTPKDEKKDQTYFLYNLKEVDLKNILFPLAAYDKKYIKEKSQEIGLKSIERESFEICFVSNDDIGAFLEDYTKKPLVPGNIVDNSGYILGRHKGIENYTIGQRRGLGVATGKRVFVTEINPEKNQVTLGDEEDLFKKRIIAKDINFIGSLPIGSFKAEGKARYQMPKSPCYAEIVGDRLEIEFEDMVRAPTKGQSVVLYEGDRLLGGGIIELVC